MTPSYGIDTSILVRLVTGDPEEQFLRCAELLRKIVEEDRIEIFAGNQVIGEAYMALQHHYGAPKRAAREGLATVLSSGLVSPLGGQEILILLRAEGGCGLLDRLIARDYQERNLDILTLDARMAKLPRARLLAP